MRTSILTSTIRQGKTGSWLGAASIQREVHQTRAAYCPGPTMPRRNSQLNQDVMKRLEEMFRCATLSTPEYHPPVKVEVLDARRCSVHTSPSKYGARRGSMPALTVRRDSFVPPNIDTLNRRASLGVAKSHQQLIFPGMYRRDSLSKSQTLVPASAILRRDSFGGSNNRRFSTDSLQDRRNSVDSAGRRSSSSSSAGAEDLFDETPRYKKV